MEAKTQEAADKLLITTARLEGWDACDDGSEWFAAKYPSGEAKYAEVFEALMADKREDDAAWLFKRVFIQDETVCGALAPIVQIALPASQHAEVLFGSKKSAEVTLQRSWMSFDWLVREHLPTWLERSPACAEHAAKLRALAPITSEQQLADAKVALDQARSAAAAWAAARAAAWDAAQKGELKVGDSYERCREVMDAALKPTQTLLMEGAQALCLRMVNVELRQITEAVKDVAQ
jgi:hypothetical protein